MKLLVVTPEPVDAAFLRNALGDEVRGAEVLVVSPATNESKLAFWVSDADDAIDEAETAQVDTVERLEEEGIDAAGAGGRIRAGRGDRRCPGHLPCRPHRDLLPPRRRARLPRGRGPRRSGVPLGHPGHPRADLALSYRATGADPPFVDPRRAHGIGFEGYYWRFTGDGWSIAAIAGVCRDARGEWAMATLCAEPGGFERTAVADVARADPRRFGVTSDLLRATPDALDVALDGATLSARFSTRRDWPRRSFGALGPVQAVPWLGQYWTPHLLSASVSGHAVLGDREISLDGARVYAEKNWGTAFAAHWWWGQASLDGGAGVAFAGGRVHGVAPTAVVAWTPDGLVSLAPPIARTVARASGGEWHIRARSPRHTVEIRGEAAGRGLRLPVPIPAERRLELRSEHHLAGRLEVTVRRGRRVLLRGETALAGLEDGRP